MVGSGTSACRDLRGRHSWLFPSDARRRKRRDAGSPGHADDRRPPYPGATRTDRQHGRGQRVGRVRICNGRCLLRRGDPAGACRRRGRRRTLSPAHRDPYRRHHGACRGSFRRRRQHRGAFADGSRSRCVKALRGGLSSSARPSRYPLHRSRSAAPEEHRPAPARVCRAPTGWTAIARRPCTPRPRSPSATPRGGRRSGYRRRAGYGLASPRRIRAGGSTARACATEAVARRLAAHKSERRHGPGLSRRAARRGSLRRPRPRARHLRDRSRHGSILQRAAGRTARDRSRARRALRRAGQFAAQR
ncbi:hypothetical protein JHFBIEKO_5589 [Methylobacterium mesophilicum]|nr:hypothetical protein JHFBIEKO_5589 [Methylobacterium mesophilicum]